MDQKNNIVIALSEEADSALLDIEKKYNLEEKDEEWMKKLKEKKPFNRNILINLTREFVKNNIQEKEFINSLRKDLNINNEIAEKIFKDIDVNVMSTLVKTSEEAIKKDVFQNQDIDSNSGEQKQPINIRSTRLIKEEKPTNNTYDSNKIRGDIKEIQTSIPTEINTKINRQKQEIARKKIIENDIEKSIKKENTKKQTDTYREPIE